MPEAVPPATEPPAERPAGYASSAYLTFHDLPASSAGGARTWWVRAQHALVGYSEVTSPTTFRHETQPDEWMLLLPDVATTGTVHVSGERRPLAGRSLVVVPPGDAEVEVSGGVVVRMFPLRHAELAANAANADDYVVPHPHVAEPPVLPPPPDGYRIRSYSLDTPAPEGCFGRIWRCTTLMVNVLHTGNGPRDTTSLSPHSHDDFEQITLALAGDHVHHLRWPWGPDMADWRPDEHEHCPAPSAAVIPARVIHTAQAVGDGVHQLVDVFCPPRADFASRGWVLNAEDYPL